MPLHYATGLRALCERYERLYLGVVSDALDSADVQPHFLGKGIRPIAPIMRVAGPAFTVRGGPSQAQLYSDDAERLLAMFETVPEHSVLVYETNDPDSDAAHFGELSATALMRRGARGIVLDGSVRDTRFLTRIGFPVFCSSVSPLDGYGRWHITEYQVPIVVGGTTITPGDFIVGEADGIVVVPAELAEAIAATAERGLSIEDTIRESLGNGSTPSDLFAQFGRF